MQETLLGKESPYSDTYAPELLVAIPRQPIREKLGINPGQMYGVDIWNHWEVSYLNDKGKPQVVCLEIGYDANSANIIESKSMKLYFNSLNQTAFDSLDILIDTVKADLEQAVTGPVTIAQLNESHLVTDWINDYHCIDNIDIDISDYQPIPGVLKLSEQDEIVTENLCSHLFKTNCMVTGQPDWATVLISYTGKAIDHSSLLTYLISFRNHQAFHEPSCEMIYTDILARCKPQELSVYCRYTRRGGIDINPYRGTSPYTPSNLRVLRQ